MRNARARSAGRRDAAAHAAPAAAVARRVAGAPVPRGARCDRAPRVVRRGGAGGAERGRRLPEPHAAGGYGAGRAAALRADRPLADLRRALGVERGGADNTRTPPAGYEIFF